MQAQCCPVCHGKGIVAPGFYDRPGMTWSAGTNAEAPKCRSCDGKGYVAVPNDPVTIPMPHTPAVRPYPSPTSPTVKIEPTSPNIVTSISPNDTFTVRYDG